jgi:hypothetical protein
MSELQSTARYWSEDKAYEEEEESFENGLELV